MSLLTWDKPRPRNSRGPALLAAERQSQAGELTPLRMTLVGAMLIAVGPISMTLYTPALTLLAHLFATTEDAIRTTITVYLFGFALAQLLCGPLSDRFGRRPVVLVCLVLYVVGAAVCAGAGSVTMLYLGRLVQGIGACGGMALSRVMVVDRFSGPPAARIISLMSLILSIAPAAAPVLGGTLITIVSWRVLFVMMALYGAGLWLLVWRFPETNARRDPLAIRPRALLGNYRMLLTSRAFLGQIVLTAFAVGGFYTAQTLTPFILMGRLGVSSTMFGFLTAALMVSYLAGALATNRLLRFVAPHRLVVLGAMFVMLAALALAACLRVQGRDRRGNRSALLMAVRAGLRNARRDDRGAGAVPAQRRLRLGADGQSADGDGLYRRRSLRAKREQHRRDGTGAADPGLYRRCRLSRVESAAPGIKRAYRSRVVAAGLPGVRA